MESQCQYIKLRSNGKTSIRCQSSATHLDKLDRVFCALHSYSGVAPLRLIAEVECCSIIEQDSIWIPLNSLSSVRVADALTTKTNTVAPLVRSSLAKTSIIDLTERTDSLVICEGNNYANLGELVEAHSCYLPKAKIAGCEWRMLGEKVLGEINGLPMFRGFALATNGVHVAIETSSGALLFGHANWFVVDKHDKHLEHTLFNKSANKVNNTIKQLEELFEL